MDWVGPHPGLTITDRERALRERDIRTDTLTRIKTAIHPIGVGAAGIQQGQSWVFGLGVGRNANTIILVPTLRFDLASYTLVAYAYILPLNEDRARKVKKTLVAIVEGLAHVEPWGDEFAS